MHICQNKCFFLLTCLPSLFIHCTAPELTRIFSDIMNFKDCVWFSYSLVLPQVKTHSGGYLGHCGEGIGGKELYILYTTWLLSITQNRDKYTFKVSNRSWFGKLNNVIGKRLRRNIPHLKNKVKMFAVFAYFI